MRLRLLRLPALVLALAFLEPAFDAPRPAEASGSTCNPRDCLTNAAVNNRVQPTTVSTDNAGDSTFFASQSGQLPNVMFVLDNSTSMYELPYDVASFPNSSWVNQGTTPTACGSDTNRPCTAVSFNATKSSCGGNTFFAGLSYSDGTAYDKSKVYPPADPAFSSFFSSNSVYKFMEWNTAGAGGVANGGPIGFTPASSGSGPGTVTGTVGQACSGFAGAGVSGDSGRNAWTLTQAQRCQQCLDEVGYYIAPGSSTNDNGTGNILFKGNFLNFYPPKFIIARKAITDFIARQSTTSTPVRIGVVAYDPANLGSDSIPDVSVGFTNRNDGGAFISNGMIPDCNVTSWTGSSVQSQQTSLISAVRGISFGTVANPVATPLAETLFNVGQFFSGSDTFYTNTFGAQWLKTGFTAPTGGNKPLCAACQLNAIVLITDGVPLGDNNLPQQFRNNAVQCPRTPTTNPDPCGTDQDNGSPNLLDDVTNFLANTDLSPDATGGLAGAQSVVTYVIGMGLKVPLLDNAARNGKSTAAVRANDAQDLQDQVSNAVVSIVGRATAFSSAAVQTLQLGTGSSALVPRFIPGAPTDPIWEGHLFRFDIFNEFVAGQDLNGDGKLDGVFLVDKDKDILTEDDKGALFKVKNGQAAVPVWDAGAQLQSTSPGARKIYTALWNTSTSKWDTVAIPDWDGASAKPPNYDAIGNALGIDGTNACAIVQASLASPIDPSYLSNGVFDRDHCILAILDYVRGWNTRNEQPNTTSVNASRLHLLGDIFHSSPVVVDPPVDQFFCDLGLHTQCVSTLYQYDPTRLIPKLANAIPSDSYTVTGGTITAYEKYWRDHQGRQRVVLVGANDGMIHAFDAGSPTTFPPTLDNSVAFRSVKYTAGSGNEVWAFIPPDQLPRLWLMFKGHQTYIDGDIMVRDVWVDGVQNDKGGAGYTNKPLIKQDVEYHTVAVASERQGGNHFFALDVTDTTTPKFLWVYPPPCSDEEAMWGQTWSQFSPRPPPIGPVLLQTSNSAGPANYGFSHTEERYAVFLNGGHSPYMNRGRIAALLDVYTGSPLFTASYNPSADSLDPARAMRFGFPAPGALVDYGVSNSYQADGFFDTAVVGDEGGQLWTFRMSTPGHIDTSTGLVDNWTFGRAFEPNPSSGDDPRYHQPIYNLASTSLQPDTGWLRAFVGSGDRAHPRSQNGGDCRPDDPMSCVAAGCTVSSTLTMDSATRRYSSSFASASGTSAASPAIASPSQALSTLSGPSCATASVSETVQVASCPISGMDFTENTLSFSCNGSSCSEGSFPQPVPSKNRNATASPPIGPNTFIGVAVLANGALTRAMNAPADASAYDQNRYALANLVDVTSTTANANGVITSTSSPAAAPTSPGWAVKYATLDEKTVTGAAILGGCVLWNTLLPSGGAAGCASAGANVATTYQSDPFTGAPTCASSFVSGSAYLRTITRNVLSPPPEPAATIAVGASGSSMQLSVLEIQPGAQQVTQTVIGANAELLQMIQSLPLTADQHICRHVDPTKCK